MPAPSSGPAIDRSPDGPDPLIADSARRFVDGEKDLTALRARRGTLPGFDENAQGQMSEAGWFGALIPEAYGGLGLRFADMAAIVTALGHGLLGEAFVGTAVLGARALLHGDNEALKREWLPRLAAGKAHAALAWQERSTNIDPLAIETVAREDGDHFLVTGTKRFINGAHADLFLVSARTNHGPILLCLPSDTPGLAREHEWRADGTPALRLSLTELRVPRAQLTASASAAQEALARALDEAAVMAAAESLGVMSEALSITLAYLRTRQQFGRPIGSFQALQHRAADLYLHRELAAASVAAALRVLQREAPTLERRLAASRAKYRCAEAGMRIARDSIQLHGAMGFTDECDIGLYLKRALVLAGWLGNADLHKARVRDSGVHHLIRAGAPRDGIDEQARSAWREQMARDVSERDWNAIDDEVFRQISATFFRDHLPAELKFLPRRPSWDEVKPWYLELSRHGWLAPAWPTVHGGMGLNAAKLMIYHEEMGRSGAPRHLEQGINYIGPLLIARGSEAQKAKYLPRILSGEHLWCQGYSEPNAGSDLAGLSTRARVDDDGFVIDGQKIWTTMAHYATHMYALVRTDTSAERHAGISLILLEMDSPGITVRPIRNIAGHEEFCQVFLDGVRAPRENLVGELNDGWNVARTLLGFERNTVGSPRTCLAALERLDIAIDSLSEAERAPFIDRMVEAWLDVADLASMYERFVQAVRGGANPGFEVSVMKIWATETLQRLTELLIDVLGDQGYLMGKQSFAKGSVDVLMPFLDSRSTTISAGSSQVQRNVLAKRVLGL
ncbi:MAG: acyl-CoA dehydrogenase [Burkholderiaceae bacterium]